MNPVGIFNRNAYQYLQQLLEVAGDESVIFMKRPATLLRVVPVTGEVAEDHLQPLFIVTHLALRQRCTQVLQGRIRNISTLLHLFNPLQRTHRLTLKDRQNKCFVFCLVDGWSCNSGHLAFALMFLCSCLHEERKTFIF